MPAGLGESMVGQGGGDKVCGYGDFLGKGGLSCMGNDVYNDQLFLMKNDSLLEFESCINLGHETIAAQWMLVDSGVSTNFMSVGLYEKITSSGGQYSLGTGRWM